MRVSAILASLAFGFGAAGTALADVVVGPLPMGTPCPYAAMSSTKGRDVYCTFNPNVLQAGIGKCPSGVPPVQAEQSTVGRNTWCVISKPPQSINKTTQAPAPVVKSTPIQECVMPKSKATPKGLETLGMTVYQYPDTNKIKVLKALVPYWAVEKSGKWLKLIASENTGTYKSGFVMGWVQASELEQLELRNCN